MNDAKSRPSGETTVVYKVMYGKDVLFESTTYGGAERFVLGLSNDAKSKAKIIQSTLDGLEVLLG